MESLIVKLSFLRKLDRLILLASPRSNRFINEVLKCRQPFQNRGTNSSSPAKGQAFAGQDRSFQSFVVAVKAGLNRYYVCNSMLFSYLERDARCLTKAPTCVEDAVYLPLSCQLFWVQEGWSHTYRRHLWTLFINVLLRRNKVTGSCGCEVRGLAWLADVPMTRRYFYPCFHPCCCGDAKL